MKYKLIIGIGVAIALILVMSGVLLYGQAQTIPSPAAAPGIVAVGTPTQVKFTINLSRTPSVIPASVNLLRLSSAGAQTIVATMKDDGKAGDTVAGDKIFTTVLNMTEAQPLTFGFQVSVAFPGQLRRTISPVLQFAALAPTTIPVVLPPDPGPAGKQTLAGVDSDNDGIRDDIFRAIVFAAPDSEKNREGMKDVARAFQSFELATTSVDAEIAHQGMGKADACLYLLNRDSAAGTFSMIKSFVINTDDRLRAYYNTESLLGTEFGRDYGNPCSFNPAILSN